MPLHLRRLLTVFTLGQLGSWTGTGAIAWIAVRHLDATGTELGLLLGLGTFLGILLANLATPRTAGAHPATVLGGSALVAALAAASLAVAGWLAAVTLVHLGVTLCLQTAAGMLQAARIAPAMRQVAGEHLDEALGRQEAIAWTATIIGPALGGLLTDALGVEVTLLTVAVLTLGSAVAARGVAGMAWDPPAPRERPRADAGYRTIAGSPLLRRLLGNALLFTAGSMASTPLVDLLLLRTLELSALEFGLSQGLPCLGGILAGMVVHRLMGRFGRRPVLLASGVARTLWIAPLALVPTGLAGLAVVVGLQLGLLLAAGFFNPAFSRVRMDAAPGDLLAPVIVAWATLNRAVSAAAMALGGVLGSLVGIRPALVVVGLVTMASALFLVALPHPPSTDPEPEDAPAA
ncbi:Major Facilitator Superfamily protein [Kytococcus aerolatus]|uniref:Major Facilitator Superfamily protein n=1 Tax=Kytococcus aerolatus TaxID=592308 RepID=A0A212TB94_9MICO|nr:MFS transporter [Kytococcus aerolatus]SNC63275.1 Major Facilitator Superfamily protein [Kytococcus aerolatus]